MIQHNEDLDQIEERATDWVIRRDAGMTPELEQELKAWLDADPRHLAVFAEMDAALAALHRPRELGLQKLVIQNVSNWEVEQQRIIRRRRSRITRTLLGLAASLVIGFTGYFAYTQFESSLNEPGLATMRLQPEQQRLPDGSLVELNANSEISVDYTPERRGVRLIRGEAHFSVTKDPARPFIVSAGTDDRRVEVRAVGTAFSVRLDPSQVDVLVTEGTVAVETRPETGDLKPESEDPSNSGLRSLASVGPAKAVQVSGLSSGHPQVSGLRSQVSLTSTLVTAGNRLVVDLTQPATPAVTPATAVEVSAALAWREARFEFTNTPLSEAVELFNQKSHVKIAIGDPSLADVRLSGIYWANNPDGFTRLIETSLDIASRREGEDRIILIRRH